MGDIVGILDSAGALVVEYKYDAWGYLLTRTGSMANTLGYSNPFRYRGYIFDDETWMYWVQSRYYYPELHRFINADIAIEGNLFTYCGNSPIIHIDTNGQAFTTCYGDMGIGANMMTLYGGGGGGSSFAWSYAISNYQSINSNGFALKGTEEQYMDELSYILPVLPHMVCSMAGSCAASKGLLYCLASGNPVTIGIGILGAAFCGFVGEAGGTFLEKTLMPDDKFDGKWYETQPMDMVENGLAGAIAGILPAKKYCMDPRMIIKTVLKKVFGAIDFDQAQKNKES